jgi:hypothetical protein
VRGHDTLVLEVGVRFGPLTSRTASSSDLSQIVRGDDTIVRRRDVIRGANERRSVRLLDPPWGAMENCSRQ